MDKRLEEDFQHDSECDNVVMEKDPQRERLTSSIDHVAVRSVPKVKGTANDVKENH